MIFLAQKLGYMSVIGIVNFVISCMFAQLIHEYISSPYDSQVGVLQNMLVFYGTIACIIVCAYLTRQLVEFIPKGMITTSSFDPNRVKETRATVATAFAYFMYLADDLKTYKYLLKVT